MATINSNKHLLNVSSQTFLQHREGNSGSNEDRHKDITRNRGRVSWVKTMVTPTLTNMCRTTNRPSSTRTVCLRAHSTNDCLIGPFVLLTGNCGCGKKENLSKQAVLTISIELHGCSSAQQSGPQRKL